MPKRETTAGGAPPRAAGKTPFRYTAVVYQSGEIPEIVETIGRRRVRVIDPRGREGRELLRQGRVKLWLDPEGQAERLPVDEVLHALLQDAREEVHRSEARAGDRRHMRDCHRRLETLERWRAFYTSDPGRDH